MIDVWHVLQYGWYCGQKSTTKMTENKLIRHGLLFPSKPTRKIRNILFNSKCVLDVGCGSGWLKEYVNGAYVGLTNNKLELKHDVMFVDLEKNDLNDIPSNSFDVVYAGHIIEHLIKPDVKNVLKHLHRITKINGCCIIVCPTDHLFFYGCADHVRPHDHGSLSELLKDFNDVKWTYTRLDGLPIALQKYLRFIPLIKLLFCSEITAWGFKEK